MDECKPLGDGAADGSRVVYAVLPGHHRFQPLQGRAHGLPIRALLSLASAVISCNPLSKVLTLSWKGDARDPTFEYDHVQLKWELMGSHLNMHKLN